MDSRSKLENPVELGIELSDEQIDEYRDAFNMFDKDEDGMISTTEIGTIMRACGLNPTGDELQDIVNEADYNGNGTIEFGEFVKMMIDVRKPTEREEEVLEAFRVFDSDNKGYIDSRELREVIINLDDRNKSELRKMIKDTRLDCNRRISFEEFCEMLKPLDG